MLRLAFGDWVVGDWVLTWTLDLGLSIIVLLFCLIM